MNGQARKYRGTRSQERRTYNVLKEGPWRRLVGPADACPRCGGACEINGHACLACGATGRAA